MRVVVQRVSSASVTVEAKVVGEIQKGLLVLIGFAPSDTEKDLNFIANKICGLRIFNDENDKMNLSVQDVQGSLLLVSQFTLYGDVQKGFRPSFSSAAPPNIAEKLFGEFVALVRQRGIPVQTGIFGADMQVALVNDGPVTIILDTTAS